MKAACKQEGTECVVQLVKCVSELFKEQPPRRPTETKTPRAEAEQAFIPAAA